MGETGQSEGRDRWRIGDRMIRRVVLLYHEG